MTSYITTRDTHDQIGKVNAQQCAVQLWTLDSRASRCHRISHAAAPTAGSLCFGPSWTFLCPSFTTHSHHTGTPSPKHAQQHNNHTFAESPPHSASWCSWKNPPSSNSEPRASTMNPSTAASSLSGDRRQETETELGKCVMVYDVISWHGSF